MKSAGGTSCSGRALSRRALLKRAAAALAGPYVLTSAALGRAPERAPASERIALGIIGCGRRCRSLLPDLSRDGRVQLVALCDVDAHALKQVASYTRRRRGDSKLVKDYREVLADRRVDAVVIATPDHWHAVIAVEAARAGKDIYCESPLSLTVREARAMAIHARRYGCVFQVGTQYRSYWQYREACRLVRDGRLGKIRTVYALAGQPSRPCFLPAGKQPGYLDWDMWLGPAPWADYHPYRCSSHTGSSSGWRAWRDYSGGTMTYIGGHLLDAIHWALDMDGGGPVEVIPPDGAASRPLTWRYPGGVTVVNARGDKKGNIQFNGSEGVLVIGLGKRGYQSWPEDIAASAEKSPKQHYWGTNDHIGNFLDCVRTRKRCVSDVEIACRSITACHLANIASWLGRAIRWDPQKEEIIGDAQASRWLDRPKRPPWRL
ncbi:MAG: Gfo/Idh/MocA family oxidoreductase [Planctomycetes bacterium]|nr:Gfo/Idh/MocA family oxidoreductase [Planctomycetota bacterium]